MYLMDWKQSTSKEPSIHTSDPQQSVDLRTDLPEIGWPTLARMIAGFDK